MRPDHLRFIINSALLAALLLAAGGGAGTVEARQEATRGPSPLVLGMMTPDIPGTICTGQKIKLEFYVGNFYGGAPKLQPPPTITVTFTPRQGKVNPGKYIYPSVIRNKTYVNSFTYTAPKKKGKDTVAVLAIMDREQAKITLPFDVKECKASLIHSKSTKMAGGGWTILNTYSGTGSLSVDEDGNITGSGSEDIQGEVMPFSGEGVTCSFSPPWEGSASVSFSGQAGEGGEASVTMDIGDLSVNSTTMTCSGEDNTSSSTWPGYTYGACQVQLAGLTFEAATLDVPFNCPGSDPYSVSITIAPRSQS